MKKVVINVVLVLVILLIYILQSDFFNWFTFAGVKPNLFIIIILFIGLFTNKIMGVTYGVIVGFVLDLLIGTRVGIYTILLGLIGFIASLFDKNFSKDSRVTIMIMVSGATLIFEVLFYLLNYIFFNTNIEIINFIIILIIEIIYNILLTIILYPLFQKFGYYIENEYKGNKILTRYF